MLTEGSDKIPQKPKNNSKVGFLLTSVLSVLLQSFNRSRFWGRKHKESQYMISPGPFSAIYVSQVRRMASACVGIRPTEIMYTLRTKWWPQFCSRSVCCLSQAKLMLTSPHSNNNQVFKSFVKRKHQQNKQAKKTPKNKGGKISIKFFNSVNVS